MGSFFFLSREEILAIAENLFIGNQLEGGRFRICEHCFADLRRIRNPLVIFASYGDNITPPHQALGWIPVVYKTTEQLIQAGQRIVYLTNPTWAIWEFSSPLKSPNASTGHSCQPLGNRRAATRPIRDEDRRGRLFDGRVQTAFCG